MLQGTFFSSTVESTHTYSSLKICLAWSWIGVGRSFQIFFCNLLSVWRSQLLLSPGSYGFKDIFPLLIEFLYASVLVLPSLDCPGCGLQPWAAHSDCQRAIPTIQEQLETVQPKETAFPSNFTISVDFHMP